MEKKTARAVEAAAPEKARTSAGAEGGKAGTEGGKAGTGDGKAGAEKSGPSHKLEQSPGEIGGRKGPEPTRYGDWENKGIVSDF